MGRMTVDQYPSLPLPRNGQLPSNSSNGEGDRCLHVALPANEIFEMLTKLVAMRPVSSIRTGFVRHGLAMKTHFSKHVSVPAAENDPRPSILQLNTEGLTVSKISDIEKLA